MTKKELITALDPFDDDAVIWYVDSLDGDTGKEITEVYTSGQNEIVFLVGKNKKVSIDPIDVLLSRTDWKFSKQEE